MTPVQEKKSQHHSPSRERKRRNKPITLEDVWHKPKMPCYCQAIKQFISPIEHMFDPKHLSDKTNPILSEQSPVYSSDVGTNTEFFCLVAFFVLFCLHCTGLIKSVLN